MTDAASLSEPVIRAEHLTAAFGPRVLFRDVSFEVRRGEVFVILGGSGCGKSTLMKLMIGLVPPATGKVSILGTDVWSAEGADQLALLRRIGVMWQQGALFGSQTLLENVEMPLA